MKKLSVAFLVVVLTASCLYAGQSTITEAEGYACMGYDKSRKQAEEEALTNAKRGSVEFASTYIKSETQVKNFQLEKDLIDAYARATVKILQEVAKGWYKDPSSGDCYKIRIKAEVVPDDKAMAGLSQDQGTAEDPSAPLNVRVWTDKKDYRQKEKIRIYVKGNKPFYARVLHRDAQGALLQLLPNPYRTDNYFNGGAIYEIPSGNDRFELEVTPPFGEENIIVYASSSPLGELSLQETGGVYQVKTTAADVGGRTRGVVIKGLGANEKGTEKKEVAASEFFEGKLTVKTGR